MSSHLKANSQSRPDFTAASWPEDSRNPHSCSKDSSPPANLCNPACLIAFPTDKLQLTPAESSTFEVDLRVTTAEEGLAE